MRRDRRRRRRPRLTPAERPVAADPPGHLHAVGAARARSAGTTVLDAARSLGVDIDSVCGGRGICGRCQVAPGVGRVRQARDHVGAGPPDAARRESRRTTARSRGSPHDRRLGVHRARPRRRRHRRPAREPGPPPGRAQGPRRPRLRHRPGRAAPRRSRSSRPTSRSPTGDLGRLLEALAREWGLDDLERGPRTSIRALQPALDDGRLPR